MVKTNDVLRTLYYFLIALAITEAVKGIFGPQGDKEGEVTRGIIDYVLLGGLFFTITRYCHGASIVISGRNVSKSGILILVDINFFLIQACAFYVSAMGLQGKIDTLIIIGGLIGVVVSDGLWLFITNLIAGKKISFKGYEAQWLISDFILLVCFLVLISKSWVSTHQDVQKSILIFILIGCYVWDYWWNRKLYFSRG